MKKLTYLLVISLLLPISLFSCRVTETKDESDVFVYRYGTFVAQILSVSDYFVRVEDGETAWFYVGISNLPCIGATIGDFVEIEWYRSRSSATAWQLYKRAELPTFTATVISTSGVSVVTIELAPMSSIAGNHITDIVRVGTTRVEAHDLVTGDVIQVVYTRIDKMQRGYFVSMACFTILEPHEMENVPDIENGTMARILSIDRNFVRIDIGDPLGWVMFSARELPDIGATTGDFVEIEWDGYADICENGRSITRIAVSSWRLYERGEFPNFTAIVTNVSGVSVTNLFLSPLSSIAGYEITDTVRANTTIIHPDTIFPGDIVKVEYTGLYEWHGYIVSVANITIIERVETSTFIATVVEIQQDFAFIVTPITAADEYNFIGNVRVWTDTFHDFINELAIGDIVEITHTQLLIREDIGYTILVDFTILERP